MQKHDLPLNSFGEEQGENKTNSSNLNPVFDDSLLKKPETFLNHIKEILGNEIFPIDVFPSPFHELLKETERTLNFPIEYTGTALLTAVAAAIGKSAKVRVKKGWYEFPSIFSALVGKPGANKSHPIETAFKPFEEIDRKEIKKFEEHHIEYEEFQALNKKEKEKLPKPEKPKLKKAVLHNFTPEILHQRLTDNDRGCTIVSEELATFLEGMNNYSKGDQLSIYLSFWSSKPTSIDRVSKPVPLWLPEPFLNIIGSIQPRILPKLFPLNRTDNGFLQRFLFSFPDNVEKQPINDFEIDESILGDYSNWIKQYISNNPIEKNNETELPVSKIYTWSEPAKKFFYEWQKENTIQVNKKSDSLESEILSKFDIHFCRLSLILQIMNDNSGNEISLEAAKGAAKLCSYFLNCAIKVLNVLDKCKADSLPQDKRQLFETLPNEFATSEGLKIASKAGIPERTFKDFIKDGNLFQKLKHGKYKKQNLL